MVQGFLKESKILNRLVYEMSVKEREAMTTRGYIARELINLLISETENKLEFFDYMYQQ